MAQSPKAAAQKPEDPTVQKKSSKKLLLGVVGGVVLAIAGGGGWYFTKAKGEHHAEEVKVELPKAPIFVPLEPFTVNLQRETSDQYLQLGLTLKIFEPAVEAKIKTNQPEIRSKILQLITTKTATELLTAEGKKKLVKEIIYLGNLTIGITEAPVQAVIVVQPVAAPSAEAEALANTQPAAEGEAASAPAPAPKPVAPAPQKNGIVDVLFTSFIIQ